MSQILDYILHINEHLKDLPEQIGPWAFYGILFAIIFAETGLVITPFLPGDSLLFAVGALAATPGSTIDVYLVGIALWIAAVLGDAVNYAIGAKIGPRVFSSDKSRLFKREHLDRTQRFYEKYGGKTIILARFVPIVRTFAPFVAGIGKMRYPRFALFNVTGGFAWVLIFLVAGFAIGNSDVVQRNFIWVEIGIVLISLLPMVVEILKARAEGKRAAESASNASPPPTVPQV